jgi:heptosyltransferase-2
MKKPRILVVKFGALGDVVRTSYFVAELCKTKRVYWITDRAAVPLLHNPSIEQVFTSFEEVVDLEFETVYSLDDEYGTLESISRFVKYKRLVGAYINKKRETDYSDDSSEWFDMGLISRLGKTIADQKKKLNQKSHVQIFSGIFEVSESAIAPSFYYPKNFQREQNYKKTIGINPFGGDRWPSKGLLLSELELLVDLLIDDPGLREYDFALLGIGNDYLTNVRICDARSNKRIKAIDSSDSLLAFADIVSQLRLLITADTLALHLAIAQNVPSISFFAPTSAAEIDIFNRGRKLISTSHDYCNYSAFCDNRSLTAVRLYNAVREYSL